MMRSESISDDIGGQVQIRIHNRLVEIVTSESYFGVVWETSDVSKLDKLITALQRARTHLV